MDFVVRLFRTLANVQRLQLVQYLLGHPSSTVSQTATALSLPLHDASRHLKRLFEVGVLEGRPSGRYVLSTFPDAQGARHPVLREVRRLLTAHLGEDQLDAAARAVGLEGSAPTWQEVHDAMCFEFTAFTHLRRLLILRRLCENGPTALDEIVRGVGMSEMAARRQLDKLARRGLIVGDSVGRKQPVALRELVETPFRRALLGGLLGYFRELAN